MTGNSKRLATILCLICGFMPTTAWAIPQAATAEPPAKKAKAKAENKDKQAAKEATEKTPTDPARQANLEQVTFDIKYLASDEMAGRQPGTPGIKLAEDYIVSEYKKAGLKPLEDGTYFQEMEVGRLKTVKKDTAELVLSGPDNAVITPELGKNWQAMLSRRDVDLDAELAFVGYGISADEHNYDDYAEIDVTDKIVVLIRREPQLHDASSVFDGDKDSRHSAARSKVNAARRAGAAGIIMVNDGATATDDKRDELIQADLFGNASLPFAQIKRNVLNELLKKNPMTAPNGKPLDSIEKIEALIDENLEPISQVLTGWKAQLKTEFQVSTVKTSNIIGIVEGEGPHADETIIIGGHYDHLGDGAYGSRANGRREIHNGADDNATGTAGVIELGRRFAARKEKPSRRLVFICFTAEEMGLLGAYHYVNNPIYPLDKTAAMINFDMIGWLRENKLTLYNWNTSPQLDPIFDAANKGLDLDLYKPASGFAGSDHLPFNEQRVPNMFIHTGQNNVYHTPEDDFEAINCEGALRVIDYTENVIDGLLALDKKPVFGQPKPFRLGVMLSDDDDIVTIDGVTSGSVASTAGLLEGDIIVDIDGKKIESRRDVSLVIRRDKGKTVKMKLKRGDAEVVLNVDLISEEE